MKKLLLLLLMLLPVALSAQPTTWFYRRGFLSDSSRVNHLLEIGGPSGYGFLDVYGPSGTRSRISYPGAYSVNLYLPSTAGAIALQGYFGQRLIDSLTVPPSPGKLLMWGTDGRLRNIDTSQISHGGGGGSSSWGGITGTLSNQTDLSLALFGKMTTALTTDRIWMGGSGMASEAIVGGDLTASWSLGTALFSIGANKVTLVDLAQISTNTLLGRKTGGTGNVEDLTATQVKQMLSPLDTLYGGTNATTAWQGLNNLLPQSNRNNNWVLLWNTALGRVVFGSAGAGTVTSVGVTGTAEMSITGSPITGAGTFGIAWTSQAAGKFLGTPPLVTGIPSLRAIVGSDLLGAWLVDTNAIYLGPTNPAGVRNWYIQGGDAASTSVNNIVIRGGAGNGPSANIGSVTITGGENGAQSTPGGRVYIQGGKGNADDNDTSYIGNVILQQYSSLSGGKVGIGTTNPQAKLDVKGTIRADSIWAGNWVGLGIFDTAGGKPGGTGTMVNYDATTKALFIATAPTGASNPYDTIYVRALRVGEMALSQITNFRIAHSTTDTTHAIQFGGVSDLDFAPPGAVTKQMTIYGFQGIATSSTAVNVDSYLMGLEGEGNWAGTGSMGTLRGMYGMAQNEGAGTVSYASGLSTMVSNSGAGTIVNGYGMYVRSAVKSAGAITNLYGLYVDKQYAGTNNWSIWTDTTKSYFGGPVQIAGALTYGSTLLTPTGTELNYVAGVTSAIQTQFTGKASLSDTGYNSGSHMTAWRSEQIAAPFILDSTSLSAYGTWFNRGWFRMSVDSCLVDSLGGVVWNRAVGDTVTVRVLWGASRSTPTDSLADLKIYSSTTGSWIGSTKVIPPKRWVWIKVTQKNGTPPDGEVYMQGRRKW